MSTEKCDFCGLVILGNQKAHIKDCPKRSESGFNLDSIIDENFPKRNPLQPSVKICLCTECYNFSILTFPVSIDDFSCKDCGKDFVSRQEFSDYVEANGKRILI